VIDPARFAWTDDGWRGPEPARAVLYEMHVGTFTPEGTWRAALGELPALAALGVTVLEVMPVTEFPGRFGWGYDGVNLYAPYHGYGAPDDVRRFVDRAHALGLAVILDVCYSHLGPDGNHLARFAPGYFTDRYRNAWGEPFNFDGEGSGPVRELILENVAYWVDEFHLDGIRIDATQDIHDASPDPILAAMARRVREAAGGRRTFVVGENEPQQTGLLRPEGEGGAGLDALWVDDFHHLAMVAATGRAEAYYADYRGRPQEFVSWARHCLLYQGQWNSRQGKRRGSPAYGFDPGRFVVYLQNHDQLANSARGERLHRLTSPGRYRALTTALLLGPTTPLLFQGQEFAASSPFLYFADLRDELDGPVLRGRQDFLSQFRSLAVGPMQQRVPRPGDPATFARSKLHPAERERHAEAYALHVDLLRLRREDPTLRARRAGGQDAAVLGPEAFVVRYFGAEGQDHDHDHDRLLVVNLGPDLDLDPAPEPLLAPPPEAGWDVLWSSEDPRYGGGGVPPLEGWKIPGHAAMVLAPR
jgi:maltooligosyltrehalose trehalohydrolase